MNNHELAISFIEHADALADCNLFDEAIVTLENAKACRSLRGEHLRSLDTIIAIMRDKQAQHIAVTSAQHAMDNLLRAYFGRGN